MKSLRIRAILATLLLTAVAAIAWQVRAAQQRTAIPSAMAAMIPQGALLTIESPDFAALIHTWNDSPEQHAWLASDNYSVFSNSRLFGRLNDARTEFEGVVPKNPSINKNKFDSDFLTQVAGQQSIFAWYDVGNLEFLYITRMPATQAEKIWLLTSHAGFAQRQSGNSTFFLRKTTGEGQPRTVAFARVPTPNGDLVVLATREDLIAGALMLMQSPAAGSVLNEPWYADTLAAQPPEATPPALHMVLNLDRIVPLDTFRSHWVQQNITGMKQYRSAVSDLYPEANRFREERAILLKSTATEPASPALTALSALLPADSGVYNAKATHDPAIAVTALEEKLLGRATLEKLAAKDAPDPTLAATQSGSATDLETRIDTPAPVSATFSNQALTQAMQTAGLDAVMTWSTALPPATPDGLWVPIHSAVVLHATGSWNPQTLEVAIQQSLRGSLTTATLGIDFRPVPVGGTTVYSLTGPKPLFLTIRNNLAIFSDDQALLQSLLTQPNATAGAPATLIAGFDHTSQRAPYARLTSLIDGNNQAAQSRSQSRFQRISQPNPDADPDTLPPPPSFDEPGTPASPPLFSRNLRSLSDAFATLTSERLVERPIDTPSGPALHQTVTYQWRPR